VLSKIISQKARCIKREVMNIPREITDAATQATIVNRKIKTLLLELAEYKEILRPWAIDVAGDSHDMIEVPTNEGALTIVFPRATAVFVEGSNPLSLFDDLVPRTSALVVERKAAIAKAFYATWESEATLTKVERRIIAKVIEFRPSTPRIEPAK
jgi:hypothetical protein